MNNSAEELDPIGYFFSEFPNLKENFDDLKEKLSAMPYARRFSDRECDLIYNIAYLIYQQGKYESSYSILNMLLMYRPFEKKIMHAHAICCKKIGKYEEASFGFLSLLLQYPGDISFAQQLAECMAARGFTEQAFEASSAIIDTLREKLDGNDAVLARAQLLKAMLSKKENGNPETDSEKIQ